MADTIKCRQGHENPAGYNFCSTCGDKISGGDVSCPHCGVANDSGANFCAKCGRAMKEERSSEVQGMRWKRDVDDFATRVDVEDLHGILKKGLIVEQGTKALLFINGALAETLMPGKYDLGGLGSKLKNFDLSRTSTAILIDTGDVELNSNISGIYTKDPLSIDVSCKVIAQTENPPLFFNNVMKGRKSYLLSELRGSLYDELQNAFNEIIGKKSVTDLNTDLSLKQQFEVGVENHLRTTFQRSGISFVQLRTIDYRFKGYDKVRGIQEEVYLQVSEDEAKLQGRKRLFDVFDQEKIQEILEETKKADHSEKRIEIFARLRQLANSDRMNEIKTDDDLEAYIHEVDKGKMLRTDEVEALKNSFTQSGMRREFLLKKIDLEQELEYERMRLVGREEVELERFEAEARKKRREFEETVRTHKEKAAVERDIRTEDAKADVAVKDLEREADEKDMELGLKGLKAVKEMKASEKREEMNVEMEKIERLSKLGIEALISASDSEKAEMLKDLKKTEMLKDMSEDQILALGAKDSPELAKAFQEKFKGLSSEEQKKLYERMIVDKDKMHGDTMKMMKDMFDKSLETQRDVSVAAAKSGQPGVVYPPPGQSGGYYQTVGVGGTEVILCSKCKSKVPPGEKFCSNCGNEMF